MVGCVLVVVGFGGVLIDGSLLGDREFLREFGGEMGYSISRTFGSFSTSTLSEEGGGVGKLGWDVEGCLKRRPTLKSA